MVPILWRQILDRTFRTLSLNFAEHASTTNSQPEHIATAKPFRDIPGPTRLPGIGHLHLFSKFGPYSFEKLYEAYADLHSKYGDIVRLDVGISLVALFRPEDIRKLLGLELHLPRRPIFEALKHYRLKRKNDFNSVGLITDNGPEWKRLRRAVNFLMKPDFPKNYLPTQSEIADDFVQRIRNMRNADGEISDFLKQLYFYTEEAIGSVCFGRRLGLLGESTEAELQRQKISKAADETLEALADTLLGFPWWKVYNTTTFKKLVRSQDFFLKFAAECLENAKQELHKDKPILQFLKNLMENKDLPEKDVQLLITEIFSSGIDATGNSIAFLIYNLSRNPDCQEKLYHEIQSLVPKNHPITVEATNNMLYLRACMKESFRLTPTAGGTARILDSPTEFSGYGVPANVLCIGINPIICRQSKYFENPLLFHPERWMNPDGPRPHPYCNLPFSHGVRRCVGQRIAEQEIRLCIIKILQNFKVEYHGPVVGARMRLALVPDRPLDFKFIDR